MKLVKAVFFIFFACNYSIAMDRGVGTKGPSDQEIAQIKKLVGDEAAKIALLNKGFKRLRKAEDSSKKGFFASARRTLHRRQSRRCFKKLNSPDGAYCLASMKSGEQKIKALKKILVMPFEGYSASRCRAAKELLKLCPGDEDVFFDCLKCFEMEKEKSNTGLFMFEKDLDELEGKFKRLGRILFPVCSDNTSTSNCVI